MRRHDLGSGDPLCGVSHPASRLCVTIRPARGSGREVARRLCRIRPLVLMAILSLIVLVTSGRGKAQEQTSQPHLIDLGSPADEPHIGEGFYGREGPNPNSRSAFFRTRTFRWAANRFVLKDVPVFPGVDNVLRMRALSSRRLELSVGDWKTRTGGLGDFTWDYALVLPAEVLGNERTVTLVFTALDPVQPGQRDKRLLCAAVDEISVRPLRPGESVQLLAEVSTVEREADRPLQDRLRGIEWRPTKAEVETYVSILQHQLCNVVTLGLMNGAGWANYPSQYAPHAKGMDPEWLPGAVKACHERGIAVIGWLPFNTQDLRDAEDLQPAKQFPGWTMKFILEPGRQVDKPRIGMCVVSSPYREHHARVLAEAVEYSGVDGVFFDGFYLSGIPHPSQPGCVCDYCRAKFREETGLDQPERVDWSNPVFRRWVRWRNEKLVEVAKHFRDAMRQVKQGLQVTCNYNIWPFANKDWETAIPMWRTSDYGVSQHGYANAPHLEWVMLGFKSRVSHDLNPEHSDIWRTSQTTWNPDGPREQVERHELTMRLFMLSALAHGTTPWHGGMVRPPEVGRRIHEAVKLREPYFSHDSVRHLGVVLSQNTHDFYGHIPGTDNLTDYRDGILGTWMLLTENHLPFNFVFDNELQAGQLASYRVLLLPNTAALSGKMVTELARWVRAGGHLVATADTGLYDEWGERLPKACLDQAFEMGDCSVTQEERTAAVGRGRVTYLPRDPGLVYARERDAKLAKRLVQLVLGVPFPLEVDAPTWLVVNPMWGPERRSVYIHLLNVSFFMPDGDTGFRGLARPAAASSTASDADQEAKGTAQLAQRVLTPVEGAAITPVAWKIKSARLAVAGMDLRPDAEGAYKVPTVIDHEVLVIELQ